MASADKKLSDPEKGRNEQETAFNAEADESSRFITEVSAGDGRARSPNGELFRENSDQAVDEFYGLTREELENYASDPKWVKVRWIMFAVFIVCWAAMLITAIVIVVLTPKCPAIPELNWLQTDVTYKVDVATFQDSDGDAVGDISGLKSRLSHFTDLNVKVIWLTESIMDSAQAAKVDPKYGSLDNLRMMTKDFKKKGIRLILDVGDVTRLDNSTAEEVVRRWAEAGVEGFVVDQPTGISNETSNVGPVITRWQQVLDEEYNKEDDRDRVVVGGASLPSPPPVKLSAVVFVPPTPENCTKRIIDKATCDKMKLSVSESDGSGGAWKIAEVNTWGSAVMDLVLKLTQAGTPNVIYGDEIGMTGSVADRTEMCWDESPQGGFTDKDDFTLNPSVDSVMAQSSIAYNKVSYYNLFKELSSARSSEESLRWGKVMAGETTEAVVFHRLAELFPPVLVAVNPSTAGYAANLAYGDFTQGEILVSTIPELPVGESFDMSAVYLKSGGVVIARLSKPIEE